MMTCANHRCRYTIITLALGLLLAQPGGDLRAQTPRSEPTITATEAANKTDLPAPVIRRAAVAAFQATHDGWSVDEVLLQDALFERFLGACRSHCPQASPPELSRALLNARKAGLLTVKASCRRRDDTEPYRHVAEIAARQMEDRFGLSLDRVLCHPKYRAEFDKAAEQLWQNVDAYLVREAALRLRKSRQLRPELLLRIADWERQISTYTLADLTRDNCQMISTLPTGPGVYLFRDAGGYLYVGEAINLRQRIRQHVNQSDRPTLAEYLARQRKQRATQPIELEVHAFPATSPARKTRVRRAYESALIESRRPRLNLRP